MVKIKPVFQRVLQNFLLPIYQKLYRKRPSIFTTFTKQRHSDSDLNASPDGGNASGKGAEQLISDHPLIRREWAEITCLNYM